MKPFEQELKERKFEHFVKSKMDISSHFGTNTKKIKLSKHSKKIDVSEYLTKISK